MRLLELEHNGEVIRLWAERRGSEIWVHFNGKTFVYKEESRRTRDQKNKGGNGGDPVSHAGKSDESPCE